MAVEIERLQMDVRDATEEDVQFLVPRIKKLLVECHHQCNRANKFYFIYAPTCFLHFFLLMAGVIASQKSESHECIPFWIFMGTIQPELSLIIFTHYYAKLNLAIERDLEQDIVELGIRLTSKPSQNPNHADILAQLKFIERLDERPCVLPMDFVPTMQGSRAIIRAAITLFGLLGPYMIIMIEDLSASYMCLINSDEQ